MSLGGNFKELEERENYGDMLILEDLLYKRSIGLAEVIVAEFFQGDEDDLFVLIAISKKKRREPVPNCVDYEVLPIEIDAVREKISQYRSVFDVLSLEFRTDSIVQTFTRSMNDIESLSNIPFFILKNPIPKESRKLVNEKKISDMLRQSTNWNAFFIHNDVELSLDSTFKRKVKGPWTVYFR